MMAGEDWLMRPVLHRLCTLKELQDGTYGLEDVMLMNEALDVEVENRYRFDQSTKPGAR
jgi:hypothetical protein